MKLNCPECTQHFSVPDKAIGPKGRKLRCSKCGHEWHQTLEAAVKQAEAASEATLEETEAEAPAADAAAEEDEEVVPFARFGSGEAEPGEEPEFEDAEEEFVGVFGDPPLPRERIPLKSTKPKRRIGRIAAIAGGGIAAVLLITLFAARSSLVAAWPPIDRLYTSVGLGVPVIGEDLVIQNVAAWRKSEGSIELLLIKGEIRNPTEQLQSIPALEGKLEGRQGDVMQEWLFRSEKQVILPGEKTEFQYELPQPGADAFEVTVTFSEQSLGGGLGY